MSIYVTQRPKPQNAFQSEQMNKQTFSLDAKGVFWWLKVSYTLARLKACTAIHQSPGKIHCQMPTGKCWKFQYQKKSPMRIISRDAAAAAAAPRSMLHFILVLRAPKKNNRKMWNGSKQNGDTEHSRHSALLCAKKQAAKDEDEVRGGRRCSINFILATSRLSISRCALSRNLDSAAHFFMAWRWC